MRSTIEKKMATELSTVASRDKVAKGVVVKRITTTTIVEEVLVKQRNMNKNMGSYLGDATKSAIALESSQMRKPKNLKSGKVPRWTESESEDCAPDGRERKKKRLTKRKMSNKENEPTAGSPPASKKKNIDDIIMESLAEFNSTARSAAPAKTVSEAKATPQRAHKDLSMILETSEIEPSIYVDNDFGSKSMKTIRSPPQLQISVNYDDPRTWGINAQANSTEINDPSATLPKATAKKATKPRKVAEKGAEREAKSTRTTRKAAAVAKTLVSSHFTEIKPGRKVKLPKATKRKAEEAISEDDEPKTLQSAKPEGESPKKTRKKRKENAPKEEEFNAPTLNYSGEASTLRLDTETENIVPEADNSSRSSAQSAELSQESNAAASMIITERSGSDTSTATAREDNGIVIYSPSMAHNFKRRKPTDMISLKRKYLLETIKNPESGIIRGMGSQRTLKVEPHSRLVYYPHQGNFKDIKQEADDTGTDILYLISKRRPSVLVTDIH